MGCIYYQDELGICCKKGSFNWENMEGSKCDYQLKNMNDCQIGITVEHAERMKDKLKSITLWMEETWDNMNVAYSQDNKRRAHPRWELKRILQSSTPKARDKDG
jgi:hypothetical protein